MKPNAIVPFFAVAIGHAMLIMLALAHARAGNWLLALIALAGVGVISFALYRFKFFEACAQSKNPKGAGP